MSLARLTVDELSILLRGLDLIHERDEVWNERHEHLKEELQRRRSLMANREIPEDLRAQGFVSCHTKIEREE